MKRPHIILGLGLLWISAITFSFLSSDLRFFLAAPETALKTYLFDSEDLLSHFPGGQGPINTVVHFRDSSCACTPLTTSHVDELKKLGEQRGLVSVTINREDQEFGRLGYPMRPHASPSAAVFDSNGDVVYFGPYSSELDCNTEEQALVADAIRHMKNHAAASGDYKRLASGCLCKWRT